MTTTKQSTGSGDAGVSFPFGPLRSNPPNG